MRRPCSTYRLQMTSAFGFDAARRVVPYLARLGVTDAYLSPIFRAAPGSTHGYDVADPTVLDPRLGTRDDFEALSAELQAHDLGLVLDIVPNHMAAHPANPWWRDVLQHGRRSEHAIAFDIDWDAGDRGRLLLPVLGAPLDEVIAAGELTADAGELAYWDLRLPLAPGSAEQHGSDIAALVDAQHYELADWREQARRLNYRRFFDITGLVGTRVEDPEVFDRLHGLVIELVREGHVTALRIDHIDGLADPRAYLDRLQGAARQATGRDEPFPVYVEKILAPGELLPSSWPVAGTTGYEFLDACDGLFVDPHGGERVLERYAESTGDHESFDELVARTKLRIIRETFWGELTRLARMLDSPGGDIDEEGDEFRRLRDALAAVTAELPVYRTYVDASGPSPDDESIIERALSAAAASESVDAGALLRIGHALREPSEFTFRWQQFCGPVTAKSVEDTAFYRFSAIPARNEVGAHPAHPGAPVGAFHWLVGRRAEQWPHTMNSSSTHDTKRSEDVRARMLALTRRPDTWADQVERWLDEFEAPDRADGWMIATTMVGAWPIDAARLREYVLKAVREGKRSTSWTDPDEQFESAVTTFAERLRASGEVAPVAAAVAPDGERTALAAAALKLFAPGVPDTYQGTEVQALALVDPDNRRPVDHSALHAMLGSGNAPDKLRLVTGCLRARRDHPELFLDGEYIPLRSAAPGVVAYARRLGSAWALVAAPLPGFQPDSTAPLELPEVAPATWRHVVTGGTVEPGSASLASLLEPFPLLALVAH